MSGNQMILLGGSQAPVVDPFFYSVTSLLHGDGTNGGQNNTFLDSSTNNFTITRNGNTTQGSFTPFSQTGWSNYFDGSGDWLNAGAQTAYDFGTGDFTVETWVYGTATTWTGGDAGGATVLFDTRDQSNSTEANRFTVGILSSGSYPWFYNAGSNVRTDSSIPALVGVWNHIAWTRASGTVKIWVNGFQGASFTDTTSFSVARLGIAAGAAVSGGTNNRSNLIGYLSNARWVKGTAVYTSNFTPSTTPLTAISGTSLLTCQANRFRDASTNNFTITRNGDVSVQPFSPFNPTAAYSTSAVGGSGYFDGSGDFLSVANSALLNLASTFSLEFWIYRTASNNQIFVSRGGGAANWSLTDGLQYGCFIESSTFYFQFNSGGSPVSLFATATLPPLNAWSHVAIARNGTTMRGWLNGVSLGTSTSTPSIPTTTNLTYLGNGVQTTLPFTGYMAGVRLIQGSAAYDASSSTITVPTAPVEAITNTSLLCNFTNGAIFDNAADADYETVGNAQISTSVKKYGTGSIAFDGTGDYLLTDAPTVQDFTFGTGDFTIECWAYATSLPGSTVVFIDFRPSGTEGLYPTIYFNVGGVLTYFTNSADRIVGPALAVNTWYHIAVCRVAGQTKMFLNGTQVGSTYADTNNYVCGSQRPAYATWGKTLGSNNYTGYIDDLRISKGVGRYPYNFTPPTAEFPNIGGTVTLTADPYFDYTTLLLPGNGTNGAQNNTFLDSSTNAFSITRNGNTTQGTFSPFSQTGWGNYFDGSSLLTFASSANYVPGSGEFCLECWFMPTSTGTDRWLIGNRNNNYVPFAIVYTGSTAPTALLFYMSSNGSTWDVINGGFAYGVTANQWNHLALVRSGTSIIAYINGIGTTLATSSANFSTAQPFYVGGSPAAGDPEFVGYISNVRFVKGSTPYSGSTITVPTTPLTAITNTQLLTSQSNRFLDSSTNAVTPSITGSPSVQAFSPFNPTAAWSAATNGGSGYFDGSGDYLNGPSTGQFAPTGNFTISMWIYPTSFAAAYYVLAGSWNTGTSDEWLIQYDNTGAIRFLTTTDSTFSAAGVIKLNQWQFISISRTGNTLTGYVNGTSFRSYTLTGTVGSATKVVYIGAQQGTTWPYAGYMADFRLVAGSAESATPPTAPATAISGTNMLLNFTNAGIYDATSKNDLETVGNAQISTTQSKFGGSSMYFDGTGDWLRAPASPNLDMGTGDLTIEGWFYLTATVAVDYRMIVSDATNGNNYVSIRGGGTGGQLEVNVNGTSFRLNLNNTVTINTWFHLAVVRYNGTWNGFVNGASLGTSAAAAAFNLGNGGMFVGRFGGATAYEWPGYIDDLRITKGIARYTSNFTPPTTAFLTL